MLWRVLIKIAKFEETSKKTHLMDIARSLKPKSPTLTSVCQSEFYNEYPHSISERGSRSLNHSRQFLGAYSIAQLEE